MAKRRGDRFETVTELAEMLRVAARDEVPDAVRARGEGLALRFPWATKLK